MREKNRGNLRFCHLFLTLFSNTSLPSLFQVTEGAGFPSGGVHGISMVVPDTPGFKNSNIFPFIYFFFGEICVNLRTVEPSARPPPGGSCSGRTAGGRRWGSRGSNLERGKRKKSLLQVFVVRMGKSKFAAAPVFLLFFRGRSRFLRQIAACVLGDYFSFPPNFRLGEKKEKKNIGLKSGVMRFSPSRIFFWKPRVV